MSRHASQRLTPVIDFNGIKIEFGFDGVLTIYAPPDRFQVTTVAGRESASLELTPNITGHRYTRVTCVPIFAPGTGQIQSGPSAPTEIAK